MTYPGLALAQTEYYLPSCVFLGSWDVCRTCRTFCRDKACPTCERACVSFGRCCLQTFCRSLQTHTGRASLLQEIKIKTEKTVRYLTIGDASGRMCSQREAEKISKVLCRKKKKITAITILLQLSKSHIITVAVVKSWSEFLFFSLFFLNA